jgi:hypothetical protein
MDPSFIFGSLFDVFAACGRAVQAMALKRSTLGVLIEGTLKQCCGQECFHALEGFLLAWIWPTWPFLQMKAH